MDGGRDGEYDRALVELTMRLTNLSREEVEKRVLRSNHPRLGDLAPGTRVRVLDSEAPDPCMVMDRTSFGSSFAMHVTPVINLTDGWAHTLSSGIEVEVLDK